jgi:Response regulator containing a CheY-like receiver domain and an HD-GYP domain
LQVLFLKTDLSEIRIIETEENHMTVSEIIIRMIEYSEGNLHDISHFMKVHSFAKVIGECEGMDQKSLEILEIAAVVHDIACPLCREKYGYTNGKYQEREGAVLAEEFLRNIGLAENVIERVVYLVGHHHTFTDIDGTDHQILLEADYLVNAGESGYSQANIRNTLERIYRTRTGAALLKSAYGIK